MRYEGMVYRPPSEARSLIIQLTVGCSHNKCTFCTMYRDKRFRIRAAEEVIADLKEMRALYGRVDRIFLADGDALCLANSKLLPILAVIKDIFPECSRVGIYACARDVLGKTPEELRQLSDSGIGIVYMGAESGSDEVLRRICKNATRRELITAVRKAEDAGIAASVTFISGMGGRELWREHATESASMISEMRPSYASWLTLMLDSAAPITKDIEEGRFVQLSPMQIMEEMEMVLENISMAEGSKCVFRSNHASNYLSLKGDLPRDRDAMLAAVRRAKADAGLLKPEYFRAL